jgi:hypothetical protein
MPSKDGKPLYKLTVTLVGPATNRVETHLFDERSEANLRIDAIASALRTLDAQTDHAK